MTDADYIVPREVQPGIRVEILGRPWVGRVTSTLRPDGTFTAVQDGESEGIQTSWSVDAIGSIRRLPPPLPTEPGTVLLADVRHEGCDSVSRVAVIKTDVGSDSSSQWYSGVAADGFFWHSNRDIKAWTLVSVPDPEATP